MVPCKKPLLFHHGQKLTIAMVYHGVCLYPVSLLSGRDHHNENPNDNTEILWLGDLIGLH